MKFSTTCVVLAALAAAPARANVLTDIGETSPLFKAETLIEEAEAKNYKLLWPALSDLANELHENINSDIFNMAKTIRNTLVDVKSNVRQITGNATANLSLIESVANSFGTLNDSTARRDYDMKRNSFKRLFEKTLNMPTVMKLIDDTKELLGKRAIRPLKMLQLTVKVASEDKLTQANANIRRQQKTIDKPPKVFLGFFFIDDRHAVGAAQAMKRKSETTVGRIEWLVRRILDHVNWLEGVYQAIQKELDNERTYILMLDDKIRRTKIRIDIIEEHAHLFGEESDEEFDEEYRYLSQSLVEAMSQLKYEVQMVTRTRNRRATGQDYNIVPYQMQTDESVPSDFLQQSNRPSWLDKTADNGCFYIYNNRTAGCISNKTFDAMKELYTSLSDKFLEFDGLFRAYDKGLKNVATQVLNASKNTTNQMDAIKFASDLETKKVLWSDNVKKFRDLSANLNAYAEYLFSEANAQLFIRRNKDQRLNNDITRFVDEMEKVAMDILNKNINDMLGINHQVADILNRVKINVACVEEQKNAYNARF